jgi:hypothetical protein
MSLSTRRTVLKETELSGKLARLLEAADAVGGPEGAKKILDLLR